MDTKTSKLKFEGIAKSLPSITEVERERSEAPKMLDDLLTFPEWQKSLEEDNFPYTLRGSGWYLW